MPAAQAGRREASEVADHAAAERHQKIAALHARFERRLANFGEMSVIFGRFARGQHEMVDGARPPRRGSPAKAASQRGPTLASVTMKAAAPGASLASFSPA